MKDSVILVFTYWTEDSMVDNYGLWRQLLDEGRSNDFPAYAIRSIGSCNFHQVESLYTRESSTYLAQTKVSSLPWTTNK
jgi:hypothetical protein